MPEKPSESSEKREKDRDERLSIPLDPEQALEALMRVNPEADLASRPAEPSPHKPQR